MLMAQQHYVEQGVDQVSLTKLETLLPGYVITAEKPLEFWQQMVTEASKKVNTERNIEDLTFTVFKSLLELLHEGASSEYQGPGGCGELCQIQVASPLLQIL